MNKTILITGASGAIGGMVAYKAALKKYNIIMQYRTNEKAARELGEQLAAFGVKVKCVQADITEAKDRERLVLEARAFGGVDVLINNAGAALYGMFDEHSQAEIERVITTDLTAQMLLTQAVLADMYAKREGSIVNISSVWGQTGAAGEVVYSAAKAGLIGFTKALAKEAASGGVRVNCVAPGCVKSAMTAHFTEKEIADICDGIPLGRFGDALEIAESVLFIAEQSYTTGQVFSPNGGMYI